jgi:hypothetical protein
MVFEEAKTEPAGEGTLQSQEHLFAIEPFVSDCLF